MGGVECISASAFHSGIKYVALGHIHKAQKIGGKEHSRYCGSPLPMSFSEIHYKHQVILFDLDQEISDLKALEIPVFVPLQRVPHQHQPLHEVISLLEQLPEFVAGMENLPYLQVRVLLDGPEPALRHKIETALAGKAVRLAKIDAQYPAAAKETQELITAEKLNELQPVDVFGKVYQSRYQSEVPQEIMQLFQQVAQEVNQNAG
jgi:exonuclease SbcD